MNKNWILATIELPNKYELCLCVIHNTDTYNNQKEIYPYLLVYNDDEATWYRDDGYECEYEVIAWMYIERDEMAIKALEQEPCGDVIDRAEAMTEIMMFAGNVKSDEEDIYIKVSDAVQLLRELPPINPQEPLTEEDYIELHDRFGDCVEFVVRDMVSGKGERWKKMSVKEGALRDEHRNS